jgi:hypothetical protein
MVGEWQSSDGSSAESQPVMRRLGGRCDIAASLGPSWLSLVKSSAMAAVTKHLSADS